MNCSKSQLPSLNYFQNCYFYLHALFKARYIFSPNEQNSIMNFLFFQVVVLSEAVRVPLTFLLKNK